MADRFSVESIFVLPLEEPVDGVFDAQVMVSGADFIVGATHVVARLGVQNVRQVRVFPDGSGFAGFVENMPNDGDKLFVGYFGGEEFDTDLTYQEGTGPIV